MKTHNCFKKTKITFITVVLVTAIVLSGGSAKADLIGYWPFEEGQGTETADITGNGNDGTFNGEVEWVAGYKDSAVRFDTPYERIVVGPIDPSAKNNAMTLAAWINWEGKGRSPAHQGIFGKRLGWDPPDAIKWFWQATTDGDLLFRVGGSQALSWGNRFLVSYPNEWIHVALTWDNGAAIQYINGEVVESGNITFRDTADDTPVTIGSTSSTNRETFVGIIDEARIYDHALTQAEILVIMEGGEGEPRYVEDEITSSALAGNLLGTPTTRPMWVWLPPSYDTSPNRHYPTIYVLHHFTGTRSSFKSHEFVNLDIGEEAANLIREGFMDEAILVMPEASNVYGGSFYAGNEVLGDYQTYIANELVNYIDGKYRTIADRESRSVLGHSMGGFGALSLAIDYPEIFSAVAALGPANADFEAQPTIIENFISEYPTTVGEPLLAQTQDDLLAIVTTSFVANAVYANAAAFTPNPDNPPYYVDLPVQYPDKAIVPDLWEKWLERDLVSQIERNGANLIDTEIYFDDAVGEVVMMPELPGIELLPAALDAHGLAYTYVQAEGDHLSHLRERTTEALKFLSPPGTYVLDEITSPALEGNLLGDPATRPMWVWLPPSYDTSPEKRYPTIYMLHGFTGDHTAFKYHPFVNVNIGEVASNLIAEGLIEEVIIVMPDASNVYGGSFYSSNEVIGDYRTYIAHDLVNYIDGKYRTMPDRDRRSIAGNSMGANGALSLAMEYPDIFGAVAAMSPSADFEVPPTELDDFIEANPTTLDEPTLVHNTDELISLLFGNVSVNLFYAEGAAFSPNSDNPPYYVDLPLQYPEKTIVEDVWNKWLDQDMVSQIERDGQNLMNTDIFIDIGIGPVVFMPENNDIEFLLAVLNGEGLTYTFVESPGDHLSHLRERMFTVLEFLSSGGSITSNE